LEKEKSLYDEQVEDAKGHWKDLISSAKDGTATLDSVMTPWYQDMIAKVSSFGSDIWEQVEDIRQAFKTMKDLENQQSSGSSGGSSNDNSYPFSSDDDLPDNVKKHQSKWQKAGYASYSDYANAVMNGETSWDEIKQYHEGGIVGGSGNRITQLANKMFNAKPNEQVAKLLKGELTIPQDNIANNFIPNMKNLVNSITPKTQQSSTVNHYSFPNMKVEANDMSQFLSSIDLYVNSE